MNIYGYRMYKETYVIFLYQYPMGNGGNNRMYFFFL